MTCPHGDTPGSCRICQVLAFVEYLIARVPPIAVSCDDKFDGMSGALRKAFRAGLEARDGTEFMGPQDQMKAFIMGCSVKMRHRSVR